jgi:hypothetical protein
MIARALPVLLLLTSCAGPKKLTQQSEKNLAVGGHWKAWQLATRALDKAPGNARAQAAATSAGASISHDWSRRIRALADHDSLEAADQAMDFVAFRANAARYVTIPLDLGWPEEERTLRRTAARVHYQRGAQASASRRPKLAHGQFAACERFVPGYRDAEALAERAKEKAMTRVAIVPLRGPAGLGVEVAQRWREDVEHALTEHAEYTRVLPGSAVEQSMRVSQLGSVTREEAVRLGRKAGAQRVVWGTIGDVDSKTRLEFFRDVVCRRVREKGPDGQVVTRWVDEPIEVVARLRDVAVEVSYEVIGTRDGVTLAQQRFGRETSARVVWTSYQPVEDVESYALVSETVRNGEPERAKRVESRWKTVCGEATLRQVLEARVATTGRGHYDRDALPRFVAGAAFVFLEELPPANDLALAALSSCSPLNQTLMRLDAVDDVDLGAGVTTVEDR